MGVFKWVHFNDDDEDDDDDRHHHVRAQCNLVSSSCAIKRRFTICCPYGCWKMMKGNGHGEPKCETWDILNSILSVSRAVDEVDEEVKGF